MERQGKGKRGWEGAEGVKSEMQTAEEAGQEAGSEFYSDC
jgi:hypothetical protein